MKKKYGLALIFLVALAFTVGASILNYYVQINASVTVESMFLFDGSPAEQLVVSENFSCLAGNVTEFNHTLEANRNMVVSFVWDNTTEIDTQVFFNSYPVPTLSLVAGIEYTITTRYTVDPMASSGVYTCNLTLIRI